MDDVFDPQPPAMRTIASICRCPGGHTGAEHARRAEEYANESRRSTEAELAALKAKAASSTTDYVIENVTRVGAHLVMQVRYPNCEHRAFEGLKTMVFLDVSERAALRWKSIDPHFRGPILLAQQTNSVGRCKLCGYEGPGPRHDCTEAPSPAARFPGTPAGWADAVTYAKGKAS